MAYSRPQSADAHEILPGIWLGNLQASQDTDFLMSKRIQAVFNCTKDIPYSKLPLRYYRVPLDDNLEREEIKNLELWSYEVAYKIANEAKQGPILIHCYAGKQRSAASLAIYMIAQYRVTPEVAIAYIKKKRPVAFFPGVNFDAAIRGFHNSLRSMIRESPHPELFVTMPLP